MTHSELNDFASRYTNAWCSGDPAQVASFYAEDGSLKINEGRPSIGRREIAAAARDFMEIFPDLVVKMDTVEVADAGVHYHWTLTGTNTGPGGTGSRVQVSGYEEWRIDADRLIAESRGHFDEAEYQRQLQGG